ncbi:PREDICTED: uncharacterized protein LOC106813189 [Priapulus caudatus]|uniref:Uncharacterized protein LOC106813189 n=1 Tax=Priapulus caudatus TaxID=37621 RepID=A0ABM1EKM1_PRICU|nr:PREDICTED: uncharacterized protein LOC106813189 [Priapulus caudatus]
MDTDDDSQNNDFRAKPTGKVQNWPGIVGCTNRSDREKDRKFFRLPAVITNQEEHEKCITEESGRHTQIDVTGPLLPGDGGEGDVAPDHDMDEGDVIYDIDATAAGVRRSKFVYISPNLEISCYWPPSNISRRVQRKELPDTEHWRKYRITIFCYADNIEQALRRANRAELTSACESNRSGTKRKVSKPSRYSSAATSTEGDEEDGGTPVSLPAAPLYECEAGPSSEVNSVWVKIPEEDTAAAYHSGFEQQSLAMMDKIMKNTEKMLIQQGALPC